MPLYAGVSETDITPPIGVEMSWYSGEPQTCLGIHDPLFARALVLENGSQRIVLVTADLLGLPVPLATEIREAVAEQIGTRSASVMLHCSHTHGGPNTGTHAGIGKIDAPYLDILQRKLSGVAKQAADSLQPAHLTYGEASAQIGINRRQSLPDGQTTMGRNWAGLVLPTVQTLCVNGADGRLFAMLFSHACHPTTLPETNRHITAEWPGSAVAQLKARFRREAADAGVREDALPIFLQGCSGDIGPIREGSWEAMADNGRQIAEAAHSARWNAHGRQEETLRAEEITLLLPALDSNETVPFAIQHLQLGGIHVLGFPAEMFAQYQQDFSTQSFSAVLSLGYSNGCVGYIPTAAEYARGGYEVSEANKDYGSPMPSPACESLIRAAVYDLLGIESPDKTPYPLLPGE